MAVFCHVNLEALRFLTFPLYLCFPILRAVQQQNSIGILLNGAGGTQLRKPGLVAPRYGGFPIELTQRNHHAAKALSHPLQVAGNLGNAIVLAGFWVSTGQQPQVVCHHHLGVNVPRLDFQLCHRHAGHGSNAQVTPAEHTTGVDDVAVLLLGCAPKQELRIGAVPAGKRSNTASVELLLGHFQTDVEHAVIPCNHVCHGNAKGGFSNAGACCHNVQAASGKAAKDVVNACKTRFDSLPRAGIHLCPKIQKAV